MSDESGREELERRVNELEATVNGLTEELVDRTERIRALEAETGIVPGEENQFITAGEDASATDGGTEAAAEAEAETEAERAESDMLVPEPEDADDAEIEESAFDDTEEPEPEPAADETEEAPSDGGEETESDDIIVA